MVRMARSRVPRITKHKSSGLAVVRLDGRDFYLGRFGSEAAKAEYDKLIGRWLAAGRQLLLDEETITLNQLIVAYLEHARAHSRRAEYHRIRRELRPLRRAHGSWRVREFRLRDLIATRENLVRAGQWSRTTINHAIATIQRMCKWGALMELVAEADAARLDLLEPLEPGARGARDAAPMGPPADRFVDSIEPHCSQRVWSIVQLLRLTGARPSELLGLRGADVEATALTVWTAKPASHKTAHLGKPRLIYFGPRAIEILRPMLPRKLDEFIFGPDRRRRWMKRPLTAAGLRQAVHRACDAAWPAPRGLAGEKLRAWVREHRFHPRLLRKAFATAARRDQDLDAAAVLLGHSSAAVTDQFYAARNETRAREVIARIG